MQRFKHAGTETTAGVVARKGRFAVLLTLLSAATFGSTANAAANPVSLAEQAQRSYRTRHCEAIDLTGSVTLEAWIKPDKMSHAGGRIIDKGTAGTNSGYMLDTFPGNSLRMIVRTEAYEGTVSFPAKLATNRWSHVAGVFHAVNGALTLYVNGQEVASKAFGPNAKLKRNRHPLCVGSDHNGDNRFLGEMARVTVYERALTSYEIANLAGAPDHRSRKLDGRVADWDFDNLDGGRIVNSASAKLDLKIAHGHAIGTELTGSAPPPDDARLTVWLRQPAREWVEAFPLGNGRLGAMVHGGVSCEHIQLNEDTLWTGGPHCYDNPEASLHLEEVRQLIAQGEYASALAVADKHMIGIPKNQQSYHTLGDLYIELDGHEQAADYRRELEMRTATARVSYRIGDARFAREVFVSHPDQVMVVRLTCDTPGQLSGAILLDSPHASQTMATDDQTLRLVGQLGPHKGSGLLGPYDGEGLKFEARVHARVEGGGITADGGALQLSRANAVTLVYTAATSYKNYRDINGDPAAICEAHMGAAQDMKFETLHDAHVADHGALFDRVGIDLGGGEAAHLPVDERIEAVRQGVSDPLLLAQSFQFGRYLLIASSRPGTQPANLQGIWANSLPPWGGKWTLNINAEMNYWPAESCNLAECHEPLLHLVERLREPGRRTAKVHYNCDGFVAHHNADLWLGTAPVDGATWGMWPMGGAWLSRHLWEHYAFSRDIADLERAYPTLKEAAEFFVDYLVEDEKGNLLTSPALSFEQGFKAPDGSQGRLCMGPTMDMEILRDLFSHCIEASTALNVDGEFRAQLTGMRARLLPMRINPRTGRILEWRDDREPHSYGTGQLAALWGLNPGDQITPWATPQLAAAARNSLEFRSVKLGSWCNGTRINFWARLGDGERTWDILQRHLAGHVRSSLLSVFHGSLFQIDGNLGATSGIAEMLLQSHACQINLLPALPKAWPTGNVTGLRARGGFEVDIAWRDGLLTEATLRSAEDARCTIRYKDNVREFSIQAGEALRLEPSQFDIP